MKIFPKAFLLTILFCVNFYSASATYFESSISESINNNTEFTRSNILNKNTNLGYLAVKPNINNLELEYIFIKLTSHLTAKDVLNYSKIDLKIGGPIRNTPFYRSVQKMVKVGALPNSSFQLNSNRQISAHSFYALAEKIYGINLIQASQIKSLRNRGVTQSDITSLNKIFLIPAVTEKIESQDEFKKSSDILKIKKEIFNDVQKTLLESHYDKETLDEIMLIEAATIGLTKGTGDQFTTYFPPTENKTFMETLDGKFEGIGSYVEMLEPGILRIVTPIAGSPSEKAGLKGGDQITHADGKKITEQVSISEAISWVKGPKGTSVELTILRGNETLKISVIRETIIIKNVEHKSINSSTYYIKLVSFGDNISGEFNDAIDAMKKKTGTKKIIIDLRNNPGGYLYEVSDMLSHFVPKGEETVVVKYLGGEKNYYSKGYTGVNFSDYRLIILQNSGSASASEIMAGTIKDYFPNTTIIGEQSYGKGSVQTIKSYPDGSSLKYTIAKWFTGKTKTGIDGIGIPVDLELVFDFDKYKESKYDNQLEKAKNIK